jgi:hypothetical protein
MILVLQSSFPINWNDEIKLISLKLGKLELYGIIHETNIETIAGWY